MEHRISVTKAVSSFLGVLILTVGVGLGVLLVQNRVAFRERAAEPNTGAAKIAEIVKETENLPLKSNVLTYVSQSNGYQINFDSNYWTPVNDLTRRDLPVLDFSLNNNLGIANVSFASFTQGELLSRIEDEKKQNPGFQSDNLELLTNNLIRGRNATAKERVSRNGRDYFKITYNYSFLGEVSEYYEYITVSGQNFYVITAKYPKFGEAMNLSENLIDSFTFLPLPSSVKGADTEENTLTETKVVELTKPSVLEIAHLYCNEILVPNTSGLTFLKSNYTFCSGALGSGFVISEDGAIATNGHVVKAYPEMALVESLLYKTPSAEPFFTDLIRELSKIQTGQDIPEDQAKIYLSQVESDPLAFQSFVTLVYRMMREGVMTLREGTSRYFVKLANDPMVIDTTKSGIDILNAIKPSATIKEARLIAYDFPNIYSIESVLDNRMPVGSDIAILKAENPEGLIFPSIKIGTSNDLKEGSPIIVIGYPGLVSGTGGTSTLINQSSSATPTITRGIISAIKNDQGGLKLIQVDASIDHGNSGGPAIDMAGNVIGIATYGIGSQSGNYNFLRDIEDLKKLAGQNSVTIGTSPTYDLWAEGLSYFWVEHYRQATIPFNQVKESYPVHPSIAEYIADSETAIQGGEDKSGLLYLLRTDRKAQLFFILSVIGVAFVGSLMIMFLKRRNHHDQTPPSGFAQNPPIATPPPPTQIPVTNLS